MMFSCIPFTQDKLSPPEQSLFQLLCHRFKKSNVAIKKSNVCKCGSVCFVLAYLFIHITCICSSFSYFPLRNTLEYVCTTFCPLRFVPSFRLLLIQLLRTFQYLSFIVPKYPFFLDTYLGMKFKCFRSRKVENPLPQYLVPDKLHSLQFVVHLHCDCILSHEDRYEAF